jgi:hypothetical protein
MWTGWVLPRPGADWVRLSAGPTLEACHKQLLARARRLGLDGALRLMTGGKCPGDVLARRENGRA